MLLSSDSCQTENSTPATATAPQPIDHFVGTWKLNKEKTPAFSPHAYNPVPVYEWIVILEANGHFKMTFSHLSAKPWEMDRVLLTDVMTRGVGIDAINGKLMMYPTYVHRIDAGSFTQGSEVSENEYKVLPDQKTMTVRQFPIIDNGRERQLVYDKLPDSGYEPFPRF